jgi:hypothetical protein
MFTFLLDLVFLSKNVLNITKFELNSMISINIEIKINLHHLNMQVVSYRAGLNKPTTGPS